MGLVTTLAAIGTALGASATTAAAVGGAAALGTAGLGIAGYSAYKSSQYQKASLGYQNQAADLEKKQVALANMRQKRDAVRQARMAQAQSQTSASNQNVSDSSSAQGGQGSIQSQLGSNLSFLDMYNKYSEQASTALGNARAASSTAQGFSDLASVSMAVFNNASPIAGKIGAGYKMVFGK